jgi:hypothetical protein
MFKMLIKIKEDLNIYVKGTVRMEKA